MELTRERAIRNHRQMWHWIADETERRQKCVNKVDAFKHFGITSSSLVSGCWLCTYRGRICGHKGNECILQWPGGRCSYICAGYGYVYERGGLYPAWLEVVGDGKFQLAAELARQIANLPEVTVESSTDPLQVALARAEEAEGKLRKIYKVLAEVMKDEECPIALCKELCVNNNGVCVQHAERGRYDECRGFKCI